jgi:hypothetical protein
MFKGFNNKQQNSFVNLNFAGDRSAYGQGGCMFWMRADFGLNTQTNGANVSSWTDYINGYNFVQATAGSQPVLRTAQAEYNNLPVIDFYPSASERSMPISGGVVTAFRTFAFIANYDSIRDINNIVNFGTANRIALGGINAGYNGVSLLNNSTLTSGTTESTSVKIAVISTNLIMVNSVTESTAANRIDFGFNQISGAQGGFGGLRGKVAEILCFENELNEAQALALSNNINAKYAIY